MTISLWPSLGKTVLDHNGDVISTSGVSLATLTEYYSDLVVAGDLVTADPLLDPDGSALDIVLWPGAGVVDETTDDGVPIGSGGVRLAAMNRYYTNLLLSGRLVTTDPEWSGVTVYASSYGVVGDGVTDDASALSTAIASAPSGSRLVITGTVLLNSGVTISRSDLVIHGLGAATIRGGTISSLANRYYTDEKYWIRVTGSRVSIRGLTFDQGGSPIAHAGYVDFQQSTDCAMTDCRVIEAYNFESGNNGGNPTSQYVGPAIVATGGTGLTFTRVNVSDCHWSFVMGVGFTGYEETDVTFSDCTVTDCHTVVDGTAVGISITDCEFTRISRGSPNFGGSTVMSSDITVSRNTYTDCGVVLKLDGISGLKIDGITCEDNVYTNSDKVVGGFYLYLCDNAVIRRNRLTYTGTAPLSAIGLAAIAVDSSIGFEVSDNVVTYSRAGAVGDLYNGIVLSDGTAISTGGVVRGNTVTGFYGPTPAFGGNAGIKVYTPSRSGTWASLTIDGNTIANTASCGLVLWVSHYANPLSLAGVTCTNNTISGSGTYDLVNDSHTWSPGSGNVYSTSGHIDY